MFKKKEVIVHKEKPVYTLQATLNFMRRFDNRDDLDKFLKAVAAHWEAQMKVEEAVSNAFAGEEYDEELSLKTFEGGF